MPLLAGLVDVPWRTSVNSLASLSGNRQGFAGALLPKLLLLLHQQTGAGQHGPSDWLSSSTANKSFQLCAPEGGSLSSSPADGPLRARTPWGAEAQKNIWQNYKSLKSQSNARLYAYTLVAAHLYPPQADVDTHRSTSRALDCVTRPRTSDGSKYTYLPLQTAETHTTNTGVWQASASWSYVNLHPDQTVEGRVLRSRRSDEPSPNTAGGQASDQGAVRPTVHRDDHSAREAQRRTFLSVAPASERRAQHQARTPAQASHLAPRNRQLLANSDGGLLLRSRLPPAPRRRRPSPPFPPSLSPPSNIGNQPALHATCTWTLHEMIMTTNRSPISSPRWRFILWVLTP